MVDKGSKNMININYKKWVVNIILGKKEKSSLKTHRRSAMKSTPPQEKKLIETVLISLQKARWQHQKRSHKL